MYPKLIHSTKKFITGTISCGPFQCHSSDFYLAASNSNNITCNGLHSCTGISASCGTIELTDIYASLIQYGPFQFNDFVGHINQCNFNFINGVNSDGSSIECNDDIDLCQLNALTTFDEFTNSDFSCHLFPKSSIGNTPQCIMNCQGLRSCGMTASSFDCVAPSCSCQGYGCQLLTTDITIRTARPSVPPTLAPTLQPTLPSFVSISIKKNNSANNFILRK